jgi:capsular polysaccharide biosynthesis protein
VSRGDVAHRRVSNEPAVIGVLKRLGFQEARLAGLAVAEQIAVFANAEVIVAPHGAGLSNLVYAAPRTRVLEMFSPNYVHPCYWSLSCLCELDYAYLLGVGPRPAPGVDPHRHREHLTIDTDQLRLAVKSLLDD